MTKELNTNQAPDVIFDTWRYENVVIPIKYGTRIIAAYTNGNGKYVLCPDKAYSDIFGEPFYSVVYLCDVQDIARGATGGVVNTPNCLGEDDRSVICKGVIVRNSRVYGNSHLSVGDGKLVKLGIEDSDIMDSTISASSGAILRTKLTESSLQGVMNIIDSELLQVSAEDIRLSVDYAKITKVEIVQTEEQEESTIRLVNLFGWWDEDIGLNRLPTLVVDKNISGTLVHREVTIVDGMTSNDVNEAIASQAPTVHETKESKYTNVAVGILSKGGRVE